MASRSPDDLTPYMREKWFELERKAKEAGIIIKLTCTARSYQEQEALYAQSRQSLMVVNLLRKKVGLYPITHKENERPVTWTLKSYHIVDYVKNPNGKARAFDFVIIKDNKTTWDLKVDVNDNDIPDYIEVGRFAVEIGLNSGSTWTKKDYPHCQQPDNIN